jgi:chromosome segregation protein
MGGVRLVDMKGDLIEASGAMVGGSAPSERLSFGSADQRVLDEITRLMSNSESDMLSEELAQLKKDIVELENVFRTLKVETDAGIQTKDLDVRKKEFAGKLDILTKDLQAKQKEKESIEIENVTLLASLADCEKRLKELDALKEEKGKYDSTKRSRSSKWP